MTIDSGDDARVAYPLFQKEYGGSTPTSPLQMKVVKISQKKALGLNKLWHSVLPEIVNYWHCRCYGAFWENKYFAVAMWSLPIARRLNWSGAYELRRFAISPDAPPNTASWMMAIMARLIKKAKPEITKLISYQDTSVHQGTIYKASGWHPVLQGKGDGIGWGQGWASRDRAKQIATGDKIRWEKNVG